MSSTLPDSQEATKIAIRALRIAEVFNHEMATLEHVLMALLEEPEIKVVLQALSVDVSELHETIATFLNADFIAPASSGAPLKSRDFEALFVRIIGNALFSARKTVSVTDILLHLTQCPHEDSYAVTALLRAGVTSVVLKRYLAHGMAPGKVPEGGEFSSETEPQNVNDAIKFIKKYCLDLNQEVKDGKVDPLIGRASEVAEITKVIARRTKNNVVLVGDPGVGKTAIAEGLAYNIVNGNVPEVISGSVVYALDIASLVAGTRFRGDFEERMKLVLKALGMLDNAILFIDEIHTIMDAGSGSKGSLDVANLLKPALAKGKLRCIGSTTLEEYRKHFEKDRALVRRFKKVLVDEPSPEVAKMILRGLKSAYEAFHQVQYTDAAIDAAVDLTAKFIHHGKLPDKAIDILDNAGALQRVRPANERRSIIDVREIEAEVAAIAKIPAQNVEDDEAGKLLTLEQDLHNAVFGQDTAITTLVDAVFISRAGLRETNKPSGSYLFVGPTGVGKTEMARQLASTLGVSLIKFDMSEYMERHAVSKLIGSPPGYVGYGEGGAGDGLLINAIDTSPSCVLLLDEIEKAHPDIFNILLQVMDDGRLTNSAGKEVSFRNVILIMTSNAGASANEKNPLGFGASRTVETVDQAAIKTAFAPEFRNRLDATVFFDRLKREHMIKIVDKFLAALSIMTNTRNVQIDVDQAAMNWLAEEGYDPLFGARPLARVIQEHIKRPLSRLMLTGSLRDGGIAVIRKSGNGLSITV